MVQTLRLAKIFGKRIVCEYNSLKLYDLKTKNNNRDIHTKTFLNRTLKIAIKINNTKQTITCPKSTDFTHFFWCFHCWLWTTKYRQTIKEVLILQCISITVPLFGCSYEQYLRLIYSDKISSGKELAEKDVQVSVHDKNIKALTVKMLKNNLQTVACLPWLLLIL